MALLLKTHEDLAILAANRECPAWIIAEWRRQAINIVEIYSADGANVLTGDFNNLYNLKQ